MRTQLLKRTRWGLALVVVLVLAALAPASSVQLATAQTGPAEGIVCTTSPDATFTLTTKTGYIGTPDANVVFMWGYSAGNMPFQHPGPVLCVDQGDTVTVILHNTLSEDVSIMFPGQENVLADGAPAQPQFAVAGDPSSLTSLTNVAAANGGSVTYSFTANNPGTFLYQSGTNPAKQVRMGLFGVLIVRPDMSISGTATNAVVSSTVLTDTATIFTGKDYLIGGTLANVTDNSNCTVTAIGANTLECSAGLAGGTLNVWTSGDAYTASANPQLAFVNNRIDSQFNPNTEFLVLLSEIDPYLNQAVERGQSFNMANYHPRYWLLNGRGFPDSIAPNYASWLPAQPYGALPRVEPFQDDPALPNYNPLWSLTRFVSVGTVDLPMHPHSKSALVIGRDGRALEGPGGEDLAYENFSIPQGPGQTWDGLFRWYDPDGYDRATNPVPVDVPNFVDVVYGVLYSGSPYLGEYGPFPVDFTTLNECGEYYVISHVHALHKITSWGTPMSGPITFLRIDPPGGCP